MNLGQPSRMCCGFIRLKPIACSEYPKTQIGSSTPRFRSVNRSDTGAWLSGHWFTFSECFGQPVAWAVNERFRFDEDIKESNE